MVCKYKDMFGKPGEGAHAIRIPVIDVALVDVIILVIVSIIVSVITLGSFDIYAALCTTLALFLSGVVKHRIFCVRTTIDKALFPNAHK